MIAFIFAMCLGVNQYWMNDTSLALSLLQPQCWYDWAMREEYLPDESYSPMIWRINDKNLTKAAALATQYPGKTWFVYNEPEGSDQANVEPEEAAIWFDKAYELIKRNDPTAKVVCCGIMIRDIGIDWMNKFKPKNTPDAYHIHIYGLTKDDWKAAIDYWHHYNSANLPTYITETCGMWSSNQAELLNYVRKYRHQNIVQIYWFAAFAQGQWKCELIESGRLNYLGNIFKENASPTPSATPSVVPTPTLTPTPTATSSLTATSTPVPTATPTNTQSLTPTPTTLPTATRTVANTLTPDVTETPTLVSTSAPTTTPTFVPTFATLAAPTPIPTSLSQLFFPVVIK